MPVHNADIAAVFEEIADLLEIQVANPFCIRGEGGVLRVIDFECIIYEYAIVSLPEFGPQHPGQHPRGEQRSWCGCHV